MFPGCNGLRSIPRKMAGSAIVTIEPLITAINTPSVVLDSTIHLYDVRRAPLRGTGSRGSSCVAAIVVNHHFPPSGPSVGLRRAGRAPIKFA